MPDLEGPDQHISLIRAGELSGRRVSTLEGQAMRGHLRSVKVDRKRLTTRRWLHAYLLRAQASTNKRFRPVPEGYVPPEWG